MDVPRKRTIIIKSYSQTNKETAVKAQTEQSTRADLRKSRVLEGSGTFLAALHCLRRRSCSLNIFRIRPVVFKRNKMKRAQHHHDSYYSLSRRTLWALPTSFYLIFKTRAQVSASDRASDILKIEV